MAALIAACWIPAAISAAPADPAAARQNATTLSTAAFTPPGDDRIPNDAFGAQVRRGKAIFNDTGRQASAYVGNSLRCANCHLDGGRQSNAAPLWAAYLMYPAFRKKNGHVNTFAERLQECFEYSMNGHAPPLGDEVLVALESYAFFLARGGPVGVSLPGRGYPTPPAPARPADFDRGASVFAAKCAVCHGPDGQGILAGDAVVFPPLWGAKSFNWGAGMSSIRNAAGFIQANMPLGQGNSLSDQDAWDVAMFVDSQPRPPDPRFNGSLAETRRLHHDAPDDMYGSKIKGVLLGP